MMEDDMQMVQHWLGELMGLPQNVKQLFLDEAIDVSSLS
jgi:hypothetical protein